MAKRCERLFHLMMNFQPAASSRLFFWLIQVIRRACRERTQHLLFRRLLVGGQAERLIAVGSGISNPLYCLVQPYRGIPNAGVDVTFV